MKYKILKHKTKYGVFGYIADRTIYENNIPVLLKENMSETIINHLDHFEEYNLIEVELVGDIGENPKLKTAVDFLVNALPQIDWDDPYYRGILQESKQIEYSQHDNTWCDAIVEISMLKSEKKFKEYYLEKYGISP